MTNRVSYAPQDFQKMCQQAERDHESKKLLILLDRVKKQIEARANPEAPKPPVTALASASNKLRNLSRSAPFER